MRIISPQLGPINLTPINADHLSGPLLPGSETFYAENDFGTILIQQYNSENYSLRFGIFNLLKKFSFFFKEETFLLKNRLSLKGTIGIKSHNKSVIKLREGDFLLYRNDDKPETLYFESNNEYCVFDSSFSEKSLAELFEAFPSLKGFVTGKLSRNDLKITSNPYSASPEMKSIVFDLMKCPYDEGLRKQYFENKVNDYLFEILIKTFSEKPASVKLSAEEHEAVFNARDIIKADLTKHLSIKEISRIVRLNEFKLKNGFKEKFGAGIFEYLLQERMETARQYLIETNKPMKEIASLTGFNQITNFITAFKKYFGHTPGELRRK